MCDNYACNLHRNRNIHNNRKNVPYNRERPLIMGANTAGSTIRHSSIIAQKGEVITPKVDTNRDIRRIAFFGVLSKTGSYISYLSYINMKYIGNITLHEDLYIKYVNENAPDTDYIVSRKSVYDDVDQKITIVGDLYEIDSSLIANILTSIPNSLITTFKTNSGESILSVTLSQEPNDEYHILT